MKYAAITLDTQVFTTAGFGFKRGVLAALTQFADRDCLYLSDVVVGELKRQLREKAIEARRIIEKGYRDLNKVSGLFRANSDDQERLADFGEGRGAPSYPDEEVDRELERYGAKIILVAEHLDVEAMFRAYFEKRPPFNQGKKRAEFPDAAALMSIESWAKTRSVRVLAVSGDKDWMDFCETSDLVDCAAKLDDALEAFQDSLRVIDLKSQISDLVSSGTSGSKAAAAAVREVLNSHPWQVDFEIGWEVDPKPVEISLSMGSELCIDIDSIRIIEDDERVIATVSGSVEVVFVEAKVVVGSRDMMDGSFDPLGDVLAEGRFAVGIVGSIAVSSACIGDTDPPIAFDLRVAEPGVLVFREDQITTN